MSTKTAKLARRVATKTARAEKKLMAQEMMKQLINAPFSMRFRFALMVLFKRA